MRADLLKEVERISLYERKPVYIDGVRQEDFDGILEQGQKGSWPWSAGGTPSSRSGRLQEGPRGLPRSRGMGDAVAEPPLRPAGKSGKERLRRYLWSWAVR